jgi:hypothetical protein
MLSRHLFASAKSLFNQRLLITSNIGNVHLVSPVGEVVTLDDCAHFEKHMNNIKFYNTDVVYSSLLYAPSSIVLSNFEKLFPHTKTLVVVRSSQHEMNTPLQNLFLRTNIDIKQIDIFSYLDLISTTPNKEKL